jgi:hypothetical protein
LARLLLTIYAEWLKRITINAAVSGSVHQGNQGNQMFVERFSNFILFFFFAQQQHTTLVNGHASCVLLLLYFYDIQCHERKKKRQLSVKPTAINASRTKIKKIEIQIISRVDPFS